MKELVIYTPDNLTEGERKELMLLVCDESSISCNTFRELQQTIANLNLDVILVMPDYQYQKGLRGWAKAHILASVASQIKGIMPLSYEGANDELEKTWNLVRINGPVTWTTFQIIKPEKGELFPLAI